MNTRPSYVSDMWDESIVNCNLFDIISGGVSHLVGGVAAPPTVASAIPTSWLTTPIFDRFRAFQLQNKHVERGYNMMSDFRISQHLKG